MLGRFYTGGLSLSLEKKNEAAIGREAKKKYSGDLRVKEPDISVKPLHFKNEEIYKMISAC